MPVIELEADTSPQVSQETTLSEASESSNSPNAPKVQSSQGSQNSTVVPADEPEGPVGPIVDAVIDAAMETVDTVDTVDTGDTGDSATGNTAATLAPESVLTALDESPDHRAPDLVRQYLREIGRVRLLTAEDEVELARCIEAGLIAEEQLAIVCVDGLPDAQHRISDTISATAAELEALVLLGREAKRRLTEANLRLVVSVAKRCVGRGLPLLDLIQEGNLGLIRAVEKFDYARGYKFSTYATWWIRQAISRALADQARAIRMPVHVVDVVHRLLRTQRQLFQELGRDPSTEEIATVLGLDPDRVRELLQLAREPVSLHAPVGEVDGSELGELIEDVDAVAPLEAAAWSLLREHIDRALGQLGDRERRVVRMRYGLTDGQVHTLEEVGRIFGVTRERVRQIEARTLAKLRAGMYAGALRDYLA